MKAVAIDFEQQLISFKIPNELFDSYAYGCGHADVDMRYIAEHRSKPESNAEKSEENKKNNSTQ
jgi:hypothetical protein